MITTPKGRKEEMIEPRIDRTTSRPVDNERPNFEKYHCNMILHPMDNKGVLASSSSGSLSLSTVPKEVFENGSTKGRRRASTLRPNSTYNNVKLKGDPKPGKLLLTPNGFIYYPDSEGEEPSPNKVQLLWTNVEKHQITSATSSIFLLMLISSKKSNPKYRFEFPSREDLVAAKLDIHKRRRAVAKEEDKDDDESAITMDTSFHPGMDDSAHPASDYLLNDSVHSQMDDNSFHIAMRRDDESFRSMNLSRRNSHSSLLSRRSSHSSLFSSTSSRRSETAELLQKTTKARTATTYSNIGLSLFKKGDHDGALEQFHMCLSIQEEIFGSDHPTIATTYNNIGFTLKGKGDMDGALEQYKKCLALQEATLGSEHLDTATTYNNIGLILKVKGDFDGALQHCQKCLDIRQSILGGDHPSTATAFGNIGLLFTCKGDYEGARLQYEKCLVMQQSLLGRDHASTAKTLEFSNAWERMRGH